MKTVHVKAVRKELVKQLKQEKVVYLNIFKKMNNLKQAA